jgi:hypothetical protein
MITFEKFVTIKESEEIKKLVIYDFDGTLFKSPDDKEGKEIYEEETGEPWPFKGWWGRNESLLPPIVPQKPDPHWYIQDVVSNQKKDSEDPNAKVVLMTGRPFQIKNRVMEILDHAGIRFDNTFFAGQSGTKGSGTFEIKSNNIKMLLNNDFDLLEIWEDRPEHVEAFTYLGSQLKKTNPRLQSVIIHDVPNGTTNQF